MKGLFRKKNNLSGQTTPSPIPNGLVSDPSTSSSSNINDIGKLSLEQIVSAGSGNVEGSSSSAKLNNGNQIDQIKNNSSSTSSLGYGFHSLAFQVKDIERSLQFYRNVLGMELIRQTSSEDEGYSMYFLDFPRGSSGDDDNDRFGLRIGMLQLIHVIGSEKDSSFSVEIGKKPGFTHFSISVPDVEKAKLRMEKLSVEIIEDGSNVQGFAVIADPDGYPIQLISQNEGKDDQLRQQLAALMSEPQSIFNLQSIPSKSTTISTTTTTMTQSQLPLSTSPSASNTNSFKEEQERNRLAEILRNARGGSPVSPISPA